MIRRRPPIGIQTFRKFRDRDCYYVDKAASAGGCSTRGRTVSCRAGVVEPRHEETQAPRTRNEGIRMQHETRRRTVIFLDIDGVLQPPESQTRFKHDLEKLRRFLADELDDPSYLDIDQYDLGAIYYDWDRDAVERLRRLCEDFGAEIVISSDWRLRRSISLLKACFRVHDLHSHVTDKTSKSAGAPHYRAGEVRDYLDSHPEIGRFVIIDDGYRKEFDEFFPEHFVHTGYRMEAADETRARQILSGRAAQDNRPWPPTHQTLHWV